MNKPRKTLLASAIAMTVLTTATALAQDTPASAFQTHFYPDTILVEPATDEAFKAAVDLIVTGPDDFHHRQSFPAGALIEFSPTTLTDEPLSDGLYIWELRVMSIGESRIRGVDSDRATAARHFDSPHSGSFSILDGKLVQPDIEEEQAPAAPRTSGASVGTESEDGAIAPQQVISGDLTVYNSLCVGFDCLAQESYGFDTQRLKENNLRIHFSDTSSSGSFPSRDWRLVANDTNNGGVNRFSIEDADVGQTPFTIEAGAGNHALYIDDGGRMGLGTSTPVVPMHALDGNTPTLRLDQDGSSGFTPQTWDVAGNEANFFIRDVTNGSALPFRIQPGAPSNSLYVSSAGNIGLGDNSPDHPLVIKRSNDTAQVRVVDTGTSNGQTMFSLEKNGHPRFRLRNSSLDSNWDMRTAGSGASEQFQITNFSDGVSTFPMRVFKNGDLEIEGTLTEASSRSLKHSVESLAAPDVLAKVVQLDITKWRYNSSPEALHVGPMAEDWHAAFGLGSDNTTVSPRDLASVALIASQALAEEIEQRDQRISELEERLAELEQAISVQNR